VISSYSQVRRLVKTNPSLLIDQYQHYKYSVYANSFLKKDTGIEIEVAYKSTVRLKHLKAPDVVEYDDSPDGSGYPEKRFRIRSGIPGLIQLWEVCKFLKKNCVFNPDACIHLHVSCDRWAVIDKKGIYIIKQHACHYDQGIVANRPMEFMSPWVRYNKELNTLEVRAVPMTFDYKTLLHYITITQNLVTKLENI